MVPSTMTSDNIKFRGTTPYVLPARGSFRSFFDFPR